jgi:lipopolysaccharide transport system ATP-binding protein
VSDSVSRLRFEGVWKRYPRWAPEDRTLRAALSRRLPLLIESGQELWALRDVSLEVGAGEFTGLIGRNGAGKSTLLRMAAGIGWPTRGRVLLPENTASVLNLGDLFDFSLSGRDNAVTAALAAGLRRRDALERLPAILEFAEIEGFEDAPLRTYSDGMRLRLAFGVIAQLQPDVLLLDEVIAVGDVRFQRKCLDRVNEMRTHGTAVLFASHSLDQVADECDQAVWLDAGAVRADGDAPEVVRLYRAAMSEQTRSRTPEEAADGDGDGLATLRLGDNRLGSQEAVISDVVLRSGAGIATSEVPIGGSFSVALRVEARAELSEAPVLGVTIIRARDELICWDTSTEGSVVLDRVQQGQELEIVLEELQLIPGEYWVDVGLYRPDWEYAYDYHWHAYPLHITGSATDNGVYRPRHRWRGVD